MTNPALISGRSPRCLVSFRQPVSEFELLSLPCSRSINLLNGDTEEAEKAYTSSLARLRNGFEVDRNMRDRDCKLRIVLGNVAKGMSIGTVVKDSDLPTHS